MTEKICQCPRHGFRGEFLDLKHTRKSLILVSLVDFEVGSGR